MLRPGELAPDFVLKDADGRDVRLSSLSGRPIILYFYPRDNGVVCTLEARSFRDQYEEIARRGAVVVGVSLDSAESHSAFRDQHQLPFYLLCDVDGHVHDLYEAWRTSMLGRKHFAVKRCTYFLDEDGVIVKAYRVVNPAMHARQIVKDLDRLQAQRSWGQGDDDGDLRARVVRRPSLPKLRGKT